MKALRVKRNSSGLGKPSLWVALSCFTISGLLSLVSLPSAGAAGMTPVEILQHNLPQPASLSTAPNSAIVSAVSKSVSSNQPQTADIVRTAAAVRKDLTADILKAAISSLRNAPGEVDCELARSALDQAISVNGEQAAALTDLFVSLAPKCAESPGEGPSGVGLAGMAPGSVGGGSSTALQPCSVCHNNQSVQIACADLPNYLAGHPGDTAGACEATPDANR